MKMQNMLVQLANIQYILGDYARFLYAFMFFVTEWIYVLVKYKLTP